MEPANDVKMTDRHEYIHGGDGLHHTVVCFYENGTIVHTRDGHVNTFDSREKYDAWLEEGMNMSREEAELQQSWHSILGEGFLMGTYYTIAGLIILVCTPFMAGLQVYRQMRYRRKKRWSTGESQEKKTAGRSTEAGQPPEAN